MPSTPTRRRSSSRAREGRRPRAARAAHACALAAALACALVAAPGAAEGDAACEGAPAALAPGFALRFAGETSALAVVATSVMPDAEIELEAVAAAQPARFDAAADGGTLAPAGPARWRWRAPGEPGTHRILVREAASRTEACLRLFVLRPYAGEEEIDGFRVGAYPPGARPPGLVRVEERMLDLAVSPRFRLGQFLAKQEGGFPKYLALRTRLLLALEAIAARLAARGAGDLAVMSGYRTPYYHARIGNTTTTSRHLFGDAADVYVDGNGDGRMDDLDGDGRADDADARLLFAWLEAMAAEPWYAPFAGGLSVYATAPHRGPFVHVDVRGRSVRW